MTSDHINRPEPPSSLEALATAWGLAAENLPPGWAIYCLHGESTSGDEAPFWIASAALRELAESLQRQKTE